MMESLKARLKNLFSNDFFVALIILLAYLSTNGYAYGWDDQHLEIPLLKHLIDPSLYKGDYYVESLSKHFSSYFYPLLSKLISVQQIPTVYFILFLVSRYFMFFWLFKLWNHLSKDRLAAFCATVMFFLLGRTEEFIYRTFSHQEFAEAFMFAGIYFFYKERYILAASILGIAANFHAIYNLFPMCYMGAFLLLYHPDRWKKIAQISVVFLLFCTPFLLWQIPQSIHEKLTSTPVPLNEWLPLYYRSCPQNFLFESKTITEVFSNFSLLVDKLKPHLLLLAFYVFLLFISQKFREDRKTNVLIWTGFGLVVFSSIFTYVIPSRFVLDLNLIRNEQYIQLFLMAYFTFWAIKHVKEDAPWKAWVVAIVFIVIGYGDIFRYPFKIKLYIASLVVISLISIVLLLKRAGRWKPTLRKLLIIIPILFSFLGFCKFSVDYIKAKNNNVGYWQFMNNWIDMQLYVKTHTPKNALLLVPINTDIGGFRIQSERRIIVCTRDCGIIGFDYGATKEWATRMDDLKQFVYMTNQPINDAVITAIMKYKVDYIVFMKYYEPQRDNEVFQKVYQNEVFSLFKITY